MKNRNFKIYSVILMLVLLLTVTGCKQNGAPDITGSNNPNTTVDLGDNVTSSSEVSEQGKLIVLAKNNNKVPVDVEFEVEFYDAEGTIVGSDSNELVAVGSGAEVAVEMWSTPENFDNYKVYVDAEETNEIAYFDKVTLTQNNNGEEIVAQVTNNSEDAIEYITVSVVYYREGKVVGIDDGIESDIKAGRSANFNLIYPYDKNYEDISFDDYKVFVTEAYSYNWN